MPYARSPILLGIIFGAVLLEAVFIYRKYGNYPIGESVVSLVIAVGQKIIGGFVALSLFTIYAYVYRYRLMTIELNTFSSIVGFFVLFEFVYYWLHRLSHSVRWLWATHSVHHSPKDLNLSAAYRLGWTGFLSGVWTSWLPLVLLGYGPSAIITMLSLNLAYQFWLHTEMIPPLGLVEYVFNTPSLHRVHHGSNPEYVLRNFGGILIVFDVIFGTYQREKKDIAIRYGLAGAADSSNPIRIVLQEWLFIFRDAIRSRTPRALVDALLGPPRDGRAI